MLTMLFLSTYRQRRANCPEYAIARYPFLQEKIKPPYPVTGRLGEELTTIMCQKPARNVAISTNSPPQLPFLLTSILFTKKT